MSVSVCVRVYVQHGRACVFVHASPPPFSLQIISISHSLNMFVHVCLHRSIKFTPQCHAGFHLVYITNERWHITMGKPCQLRNEVHAYR